MATVREEEVECESDPEEAKRSLTMRRREASDEEEEEEGEGLEGERPPRRIDSRPEIESDGESDGQGAPAEYDDEESEIEEEEELEEDEEEAVEEEEYEVSRGKYGGEVGGQIEVVAAAAGVVMVANELEGDIGRSVGESTELQGVNPVEEEKKENEPFAVPTAGAFYMHDDRFRGNAGGRHRYFHRSHM